MAAPKVRVIDCPGAELEAALEPLMDDYAITHIYWRDRGDVTWSTVILGKFRPQPIQIDPRGPNFRPR